MGRSQRLAEGAHLPLSRFLPGETNFPYLRWAVGGGRRHGLTRRLSGALTAALADQQCPQRCLFVLSGLALQSWGAFRDVDPTRLPFSPETASGFYTAVCRRPRVFLPHAAPATTSLYPWRAAGAPR